MTWGQPYSERLAAAQREMNKAGADVLIVGLSSSMRYLCGFNEEQGERLLTLLVPRHEEPLFVVPELYADQVGSVTGCSRLFVWSDHHGPARAVREALDACDPALRVLLAEDCLWASFLLAFQEATPGCRFGSANDVLAELRMHKGAEEIAFLQRAGALADRAFRRVLETPFEGRTELEIAAVLEHEMLAGGADKRAMSPLVASGPAAAMPHYRAGQRVVESGDVVILDYGCHVSGYCSDMTRTVVCGAPSNEIRVAYDAVREAQRLAIEAVRPGVTAEQIDRVARRSLQGRGFGDRFIHRTGHGIGLDIHEPPYIVEGNARPLEPGMAFSVEPGVYFPGQFGIRIEDILVVTESGSVPMTQVTHELQVVN